MWLWFFVAFFFLLLIPLVLAITIPIYKNHYKATNNVVNYDSMMRKYIISYEYGWLGIRRFPYRVNKFIKKVFNHQGPWIKRKS